MKKLLLLAVFLFAIVSYGGKNTTVAHADTLTPQQNAALEQTLETLKAKLVNLQMQAGQIPQGDMTAAGTVTVMPSTSQTPSVPAQTGMNLSSQDIAAIGTSLSALTATLSGLNATLIQHPEIVAGNQQMIAAVLKSMVATLASINTQIAGGGSNIAANVPAPTQTSGNAGNTGNGVAANPAPTPAPVAVANPPASNPTVGTPATNTTPAANNQPQTANVLSSSWNFVKSHWPTFTIILLVIAILLILFWPQKEEATGSAVRAPARPMQPSRPNVSPTSMNSGNVNVNVSSPAPSPTPVSTVVTTPAQKIDVQTMKVKRPA